MKNSKQYPIGGFAPGYYSCKCVNCKQEFQGDKRSVQCEPCAIEMVNTKLKESDNRGIESIKEEPLEKAAKTLYPINNTGSMFMPNREEVKNIYRQEGFIEGAKHQVKEMYSEEEVLEMFKKYKEHFSIYRNVQILNTEFQDWFEENKKQ